MSHTLYIVLMHLILTATTNQFFINKSINENIKKPKLKLHA